MSAKKKEPVAPELPSSPLSAEARAALQAAAEARNLAERGEVVRAAIELAKLHNHGNPAVELAASAYLLRAASDAMAAEESMRQERQRIGREEMETRLHEMFLDTFKDSFTQVPYSEIVNASPTETPGECGADFDEWRKCWETELLNEDFVELVFSNLVERKVMLPKELNERRAAFDAAVEAWPFETVSGFKKFLGTWVADVAGDKSHEPWDEAQCAKKVDEYFKAAKAGKVDRNLLDSWKFFRAKRAAMKKWGGTTRRDFWELLRKWVPSLPRNAGKILTPRQLERQVERYFTMAVEGKAPRDMVEKWKVFRASLA